MFGNEKRIEVLEDKFMKLMKTLAFLCLILLLVQGLNAYDSRDQVNKIVPGNGLDVSPPSGRGNVRIDLESPLTLPTLSVSGYSSQSSSTFNGSSTFSSSATFTSSTSFTGPATFSSSITARGISVTTYTVNGYSIYGTTWSDNFDGYVVRYASGIVPNNDTITITAEMMGGTAIGRSICGMIELVNTASVTVRKKSNDLLPVSFTIYNADLTQTQAYECFIWVKPK